MSDRPFWSDSFDMDLPKVLPEARAIVADLGDVALWVTGHRTFGALNHPTCWNTGDGLTAFFGFRSPRQPEGFVTSDEPVQCTFWEAVRDCWAHSFLMTVERAPVWNTGPLWPEFESIMWDVRGWGDGDPDRAVRARRARIVALHDLRHACGVFRRLLVQHGGRVTRLPTATPPVATDPVTNTARGRALRERRS